MTSQRSSTVWVSLLLVCGLHSSPSLVSPAELLLTTEWKQQSRVDLFTSLTHTYTRGKKGAICDFVINITDSDFFLFLTITHVLILETAPDLPVHICRCVDFQFWNHLVRFKPSCSLVQSTVCGWARPVAEQGCGEEASLPRCHSVFRMCLKWRWEIWKFKTV